MSSDTKGRPIRPEEVTAVRTDTLPPEVFDAFNAEIAAKWDGRSATILQSSVVARIAAAMGIEPNEIHARHYLDVETAYRAEGWSVVYDKPAYNESYPATFAFHKVRS